MKRAARLATKNSSNPKDSLGALKVPLDLTPGVAEIWWALAHEDGNYKYGCKNWRNKRVRYTVYTAAARRHIRCMEAGEDVDPLSGIPHAGHVMACMAIIEDARAAGCLVDDRSEKDKTAELMNMLTGDSYNAATLALTRTPARTLDEVRGGPFDFVAMVGNIKQIQARKLARRAADAAQAAKPKRRRK